MSKTFLTFLWLPHGGWREGAGYDASIVAGVDHMLRQAVPDVRHICIADGVFHADLQALGIEPWPLWPVHDYPRLHSHGFDCYMRLGLWGEPGKRLADYLGDDVAQWTDIDVMIKPTAGAVLTDRWRERPELFWIPRSHKLERGYKFGKNLDTWLGVNCSTARLRLGSKPHWWDCLRDPEFIAESERYICGSDQAVVTRLALEERGFAWRDPTADLFKLPMFGPDMQAHGMWSDRWEVAYFPYDLDTNYTKPWLSDNAYLRREYRILAGKATEAEIRADCNPGLRRYLGKR
jgi:hypothetical protein